MAAFTFSGLEEVIIPEGVTAIEEWTFARCESGRPCCLEVIEKKQPEAVLLRVVLIDFYETRLICTKSGGIGGCLWGGNCILNSKISLKSLEK